MQTYHEYRPTAFGPAGLNLDDRQDWFVLGMSINRDSGPFDLSNWDAALAELGGESDDVEVHRFGHWACGWYEIILIRPGSGAEQIGHDLEERLEDYPLLNDEDFSNREFEEYLESWDLWAAHDFRRALERMVDSRTRCENVLCSISNDDLREFHESLNPRRDYYVSESSGVSIHFCEPTVTELAEFILDFRPGKVAK